LSIAKSGVGVKIGDDTLSWKLVQGRTRQLSHELENKPVLGLNNTRFLLKTSL
jgi:hypothetical protein